jgi:hypothetical protein
MLIRPVMVFVVSGLHGMPESRPPVAKALRFAPVVYEKGSNTHHQDQDDSTHRIPSSKHALLTNNLQPNLPLVGQEEKQLPSPEEDFRGDGCISSFHVSSKRKRAFHEKLKIDESFPDSLTGKTGQETQGI